MATIVLSEVRTKVAENCTQDGRFKCQFEKVEVLQFFSQLNQTFSFKIVVTGASWVHFKPRKTKIGQKKSLTPFSTGLLQIINNFFKSQVCAVLRSRVICRNVPRQFLRLSMETPYLCSSEGHKYRCSSCISQKTSGTQLCYDSDYSSLVI